MKTRHRKSPRVPGHADLALHPIGLAALLALSGTAFALPQGATVVNGQVTVATPSPTLQVVTQGSQKAIIDWTSFSVASGEKVRFDQPSSSAVLLNRVTGYDPSDIFGQIQANGRIFLLNPYGVVFGASARVDVGGLVASSLSLSNADFLAGRFSFGSSDAQAPAQRGEVRNEGAISAPGGTVVLAAPSVTNTGTIDAAGGRVGLVAAQSVLVDVEGDGLVLFQTKATEASNRLAQLGRIQADGGSVELRAAARGAFADTVLNMTGVVQARSLGSRNGQVVIDGGDAGITRVAGGVDATGTAQGERGGQVSVLGQNVWLDNGARVDASGQAGGGTVLIGGDAHGLGTVPHAGKTFVSEQATIRADATGQGNGGKVVLWSDEYTQLAGTITARGGAAGGDGGFVETSGKQGLAISGSVDASATTGKGGEWLIDPADIDIVAGTGNTNISATNPFTATADSATLGATRIVNALEAGTNGTNVTVTTAAAGTTQLGNITVSSAVAWDKGGVLRLRADNNITVGAAITANDTGSLNLFANGAVTLNANVVTHGGDVTVADAAGTGRAASFGGAGTITTTASATGATGGAVTISTTGNINVADIVARGANGNGSTDGGIGGTVSLSSSTGSITTAGINTIGGDLTAGPQTGGAGGTVSVSATTGSVTVGNLAAVGGVNGGGGGGPGAGGTITLTAGTDLTTSGTLRSGLTGTVNLKFAQAGAGGTLDLSNVGIANGTFTARGSTAGASVDTIKVDREVAAITLKTDVANKSTLTYTGGPTTGIDVQEVEAATLGGATTITADTWTGTATIRAGAGTTSVNGNGANTTLQGTDSDSTWRISTADAGDINANTLQFTGVGNLSGGTGNDSFVFANAGTLSGNLAGGAGGGTDTLDLSGKTGAVAINLQTSKATGITGTFGGIESVVGNDITTATHTTTLTGTNATTQTFTISDANTGTVGGVAFKSVGTLVGGAGTNTFAFVSGGGKDGSLSGSATGNGADTIDLSARAGTIAIKLQDSSITNILGSFSGVTTLVGNDTTAATHTTTLTGTNGGQTFAIDGANSGSVGAFTFQSVGNLAGGTTANTFNFASAGQLSGNLVGGAAGDALNLSAKTGAIAVNLETGKATGITGTFSGVTSVTGNDGTTGANTTLTGSNTATTYTLNAVNGGTAGGVTFSGVGNLVGGSGADTFTVAGGSLIGDLADGGGATTLGGTLQTGGKQTYTGAMTLTADTVLTSTGTGANGAISLAAVDGAHALTVNTAGVTTFGGAVGATTALASVTTDLPGSTSIASSVRTNDTQTYNDAVTAGTVTLTSLNAGGHITATNAGNNFGTLAVSTSGATNVAIVDSNALTLGDLTLGSGTLSLTTGAALTQANGSALTQSGAGAITLDAGTSAVTLAQGGNNFAGSVAVTGGAISLATTNALDITALNSQPNQALSLVAGGLLTLPGGTTLDNRTADLTLSFGSISAPLGDITGANISLSSGGALALNNVAATGTLALKTNNADITQAAAGKSVSADGASTIDAGTGKVTLDNTGNNFVGDVTVTGSEVSLRDLNDLNVVSLTSGTNQAVSLVAGGALTTPAGAINTGTASLTLSSGGLLSTPGNLTGASVSLTGAGGLALGNSISATSAAGTLTLATTNASINQSGGTISAAGATAVNAGSGNVSLAQAGNDFVGNVAVTGGAVSLRDANDLSITTLSSQPNQALSLVAGGLLTLPGGTTLDNRTADLTLSFGSISAPLGDITGANISVTSLGNAADLAVNGINAAGTLTLATNNGNITQASGAIVVNGTGTSVINAGSGAITLTNADFSGAVNLTGGTTQITDSNALTLGNVATGALTVTSNGALNLGTGNIGGALIATSNGGNLSQSGALTIGGTATLNAGTTGDVALAQANNDFVGAVSVTGRAVSLTDRNALTISTLSKQADAALSVRAGTTLLLPSTTLNTGTADLTLEFGDLGFLGTLGALNGRNVSVTSVTNGAGLTLNNVTASGTLTVAANNGDIGQALGTKVVATGAADINAGTGNVALDHADNDFSSISVRGGAVSVTDTNALTVASLITVANSSVSLVAGGALTTQPGAIDTGAANLTLSSGDVLATQGTLRGTNVSLTGANGLQLSDNITALGTLSLQTTNHDITQTSGAIVATGATTANAGTGNVTLAQAGNDFSSVGATGATVSLADANALQLNAVQATNLAVTTHGALTQSTLANVSGTTTVNANGGDVTLNQSNRFGSIGVSGGAVTIVDADALVLNGVQATSLLAGAANGSVTQTAPLTVTGASTVIAIGGDIVLTDAANNFNSLALNGGAINVADANDLNVTALTAGANRAVSLVAGGTLTLPAGTIDTGTATLTLASNGGVLATRGAVSGQSVNLTGTSGIVLGGNVTTTADQVYANGVTLSADTTLAAGNGRISLLAGLDGGTHDLGLSSGSATPDAIRTGAPIGNVRQLTVTGNATLGGNVTSSANQTYTGDVNLAADAVLNAGAGRIDLQHGVAGGAHNLGLASTNAAADAIRSGAAITGVAQFASAGNTTLAGNVTSSGNQSVGGTLTLLGDATLNAGGSVTLQGAVDGGAHNLTLTSASGAADAIRTGATVGNVALLNANGNTTLGGNVTTTGDQTYAGNLTLAADAALNAGAGKIALQGSVAGAGNDLALTSSNAAADAIRTSAAIAGVAQLGVNGRLSLGGDVSTTGAQTYAGPVLLNSAATLTGSNVSFAASVDGAQALTVNAANATFAAGAGGTTALASLTTGGTTHIGGDVTTSGAQVYGGAVDLQATAALRATSLTFNSTIDGAQTLATFADTTSFNGAVGGTTALAGLSVSGPATLAGGSITTTGNQTFAAPVTLGSDMTLSAFNVGFAGSVDGAHALALQTGFVQFGGAVGAGTALASLSTSGAAGFNGADVNTTGGQSYGGPLTLSGNNRFSAGSLNFGDRVDGAQNLTLQADTLTAAAPITGSGTLTIGTRDTSRTIEVAVAGGGAGALQVSQALLNSTSGFTQQVIGNATGSGDVNVGALQLGRNTVLQSGSGNVSLNGSVDGAFDLALNTGGVTRIAGPIGATAPLRSLSTDNNATATDGAAGEHTLIDLADGSGRARIITTGDQTYADPLIVLVPVQFNGNAITALQPDSHFGGAVSATAGSLQLFSKDGVVLGDVTLTNGGAIETDGVLQLSGALHLNGGTLSLISNATPTAIGFTDPDLQTGENYAVGTVPVKEASATIVQNAGSTLDSTAGSLLVLRSPNSGSILLDQAGNTLLGNISAVSGPSGDNSADRFRGSQVVLGFVRINSSEIHAAGAAAAFGGTDPLQAGIEADVIKLTADKLTTGATGLLRARLPFLNTQGSQTSVPGMTLVMSPQALAVKGSFGQGTGDGYIQVRIGSELGGFLTVRPKNAGGENAVILLAGPEPKPFYDGTGKLTEVRVFYNGDAPRTPQESGALTAVTAIVEDARHARFEEAVRTENVSSRLRSGVIAEVGAGRPATVGRESIKLPQNCGVKPGTLQCE